LWSQPHWFIGIQPLICVKSPRLGLLAVLLLGVWRKEKRHLKLKIIHEINLPVFYVAKIQLWALFCADRCRSIVAIMYKFLNPLFISLFSYKNNHSYHLTWF